MNKLQIAFLFLSVILLASLGSNLLLYRELKNTFLNLYQTSLNPLGLSKYNNQEIPVSENPRVVFYGDSRAYAWKSPQNDNFQFINRGISGQTSAQILLRFQHHVAPLKPQVIVLQLGVNDLRMLAQTTQTQGDIVNNCKQNIAQLIQQADEINAVVILTTIFPLGAGDVPLKYRPFWTSKSQMEQRINEVNQYLTSLSNRAILLDAHSLLNKQDSQKTQYYEDLLHLNSRGYQLLNQELEKILSQMYAKSKI